MSAAEQILVDGTWLSTIPSVYGVGDLRYSTAARGCEQASWSMSLSPTFGHPALLAGKIVEIRVGPKNVWQGTLDEPDRTDNGWSFSAAGLAAEGESFLCFDEDLNTTSIPDVAIDQAIARGLPWKRPVSISAVPYADGDSTAALNKVGPLLDSWSLSESKPWGVNADAEVYAVTDPVMPKWYLTAGSGKVGLADDEYASTLFGRYQSDASTYATAMVEDPAAAFAHYREEGIDLTTLGYVDGTKATAVLDGRLADGKARYAWTKALTVSGLQITTPGGQPAFLPFVRAGDKARLFGVVSQQGIPLPYLDFIIGRTELQAGAKTIVISPRELAARTLGDVLALRVGA